MSARLGEAPFFVIEADEYDTAFFDKRAKFVHYRPRTLVLNNLEYDHADIYPDLAAIERQFQHLVRTVPGSGRIICNGADANLARVLAAGCWTPVERFARAGGARRCNGARGRRRSSDFSRFEVLYRGARLRRAVSGALLGAHNVDNALAALAAARHAGVPIERGIEALRRFRGVARRMQLRGEARRRAGCTTTLRITRPRSPPRSMACGAASARERIVAVLEPRSQTMRLGVHQADAGRRAGGGR